MCPLNEGCKFPASSLLLEVFYQINICLTLRNVRHDISVGVSSLDCFSLYYCQLRTRASELLRDFILSYVFPFFSLNLFSFVFPHYPLSFPNSSILFFSCIC